MKKKCDDFISLEFRLAWAPAQFPLQINYVNAILNHLCSANFSGCSKPRTHTHSEIDKDNKFFAQATLLFWISFSLFAESFVSLFTFFFSVRFVLFLFLELIRFVKYFAWSLHPFPIPHCPIPFTEKFSSLHTTKYSGTNEVKRKRKKRVERTEEESFVFCGSVAKCNVV